MAAFLSPFNWWAFALGEGSIMLWLIVGFFDLVIVTLLTDAVYHAARQYKYGRSRLRFSTFPYYLGETLDAAFSNPRLIGPYESLTYTLRCIQEKCEVRGGDADLRIRFQLPDEDWETKLAERPPRYWSLQIKARTPGVDFDAEFLVPVYRRW